MLQEIFLTPCEFGKSHGVVMAYFLLVFYLILDDFPGDFSAGCLAKGGWHVICLQFYESLMLI